MAISLVKVSHGKAEVDKLLGGWAGVTRYVDTCVYHACKTPPAFRGLDRSIAIATGLLSLVYRAYLSVFPRC